MYGMRLVDPEGVQRRFEKKQHKPWRYIVPGPDAIWSIDAHCKLVFFGVQIYAVIDAYSRKILWIYVGVSAHTAISVAKQYLDYLAEVKTMPDAIRSDRGTDTVLIADTHWQLCCAQEDRAERLRAFEKCCLFGKSTAN
jgi:hypothetical protein